MSKRSYNRLFAQVVLAIFSVIAPIGATGARADCDKSSACTRVVKVIFTEVEKARSDGLKAILASPPPWTADSRKRLLGELNKIMLWDQANEVLLEVAKMTWPMAPQSTARQRQEEQIQTLITRQLVARVMDHISNRFGYGISPSNPRLTPAQPNWIHLKEMVYALTRIIDTPQPFWSPALSNLVKAYSTSTPTLNRGFNPINTSVEDLQMLRRNLGLEKECDETRASTLCTDGKDNDQDGRIDMLDPSCQLKAVQCARQRSISTKDQNAIGRETYTRATQFRLLMSAFGSQGMQGREFYDEQSNFPGVLEEFWFNHFNVDYEKIRIGAASGPGGYERMIHSRMTTTFRHLLEGVITHPAMLHYLDNNRNVVTTKNFDSSGFLEPSNQNLGRELLELFTLGIGAERVWEDPAGQREKVYTQRDVEQAALMLTGVNVVNRFMRETGRYEYGLRILPMQHVPDFYGGRGRRTQTAPTVMGKLFCLSPTGVQDEGGRCDDTTSSRTETAIRGQLQRFLAFLAEHPRTRENICDKLTNRFVAAVWEEVDELGSADQSREDKRREVQRSAVRERCVSAWGTGGDLKSMYEAILTSPEVWSRQNYLRYQKNPMQLVTSALRASGMTVYDLTPSNQAQVLAFGERLVDEVRYMGLPYRNWITPDGYREWNGWISPGYFVRWINSSFRVASLAESLSAVTGRELFAPIMGVAGSGAFKGSNEEICRALNGGAERFECYRLLARNGTVRRPTWHIEKRIAEFLHGNKDMVRQRFVGEMQPVPVKTSMLLDVASHRFTQY